MINYVIKVVIVTIFVTYNNLQNKYVETTKLRVNNIAIKLRKYYSV